MPPIKTAAGPELDTRPDLILQGLRHRSPRKPDDQTEMSCSQEGRKPPKALLRSELSRDAQPSNVQQNHSTLGRLYHAPGLSEARRIVTAKDHSAGPFANLFKYPRDLRVYIGRGAAVLNNELAAAPLFLQA